MIPFRRTVVETLRVGFILLLALLLSGLVPMLIQAYGWYDMARKAGGMDQIVVVVTEAPACEFCRAAQEMQRRSDPAPDKAPGRERVEAVKVYAVSPGTGCFEATCRALSGSSAWSRAGDDRSPDGPASVPPTPPPEHLV